MGFEGRQNISQDDQERSYGVAKLMLSGLPYPAAVRRMMAGRGITDEADIMNTMKRLASTIDTTVSNLKSEQEIKQTEEEQIRRDLLSLTEEEINKKYPLQ